MLITLILISGATSLTAQKLTKNCWSNGQYRMTAVEGTPNGKIEVTVYNNNDRDVVLQATRTFLLNSDGSVSFDVEQAIRTDYRYVYVRWFVRNTDGTYSVNYFHNAGTGDDGSYSGLPTASNQCQVLATKFKSVYVKRMEKNLFKVYFDVLEDMNTMRYDVKLSTDGITFKTRAIIFPDNTKAGKYEITIKL